MSRPDPLKLGVLLRQSHVKAAGALDAALEPLSIGARHFGVLLHLSRLGESTHTELIALTGRDNAGMVRTIDALVDAGLVARKPSTTDRRVNRLTLTAAGVTLTAEARERAVRAGAELFTDFTAVELAQFIDLLQRFVGQAHPTEPNAGATPGAAGHPRIDAGVVPPEGAPARPPRRHPST